MATYREIAEEAQVGIASVARYVSGTKVKADTENRIKKAMRKLHFGEIITSNNRANIAIVLNDLECPFLSTVLKELQNNLIKNNCNTIILSNLNDDDETINRINALDISGIILLLEYPSNIKCVKKYQRMGIPVVLFDAGTEEVEIDQVLIDNINASYSAVENLIKNNHKKIGFITKDTKNFTHRERLIGYKRALNDYGIKVEDSLIKEMVNFDDVKNIITDLYEKNNVTAIYCVNYYTSIFVFKALELMNISVPSDLSVAAFDNYFFMKFFPIDITTVEQPIKEYGQTIVETLMRRIRGNYDDFPLTTRLKAQFVNGKSVKRLKINRR